MQFHKSALSLPFSPFFTLFHTLSHSPSCFLPLLLFFFPTALGKVNFNPNFNPNSRSYFYKVTGLKTQYSHHMTLREVNYSPETPVRIVVHLPENGAGDGETFIDHTPRSPTHCWISSPEDSVTGRTVLMYSHDCTNSQGQLYRSTAPLRTDLYPCMNENYPEWQILSIDPLTPLTISPSIQCLAPGCTSHGFFQNGQWNEC